MKPTTQDPHLPPSRFSQRPDGGEEIDIDIDLPLPNDGGEHVLTKDTVPEGCEHLGSYASLELYFRSQLEDQVSAPCQWLLDCVDYQAVQRRWESDGSRLVYESGSIYRLAAPEPDRRGPSTPCAS